MRITVLKSNAYKISWVKEISMLGYSHECKETLINLFIFFFGKKYKKLVDSLKYINLGINFIIIIRHHPLNLKYKF